MLRAAENQLSAGNLEAVVTVTINEQHTLVVTVATLDMSIEANRAILIANVQEAACNGMDGVCVVQLNSRRRVRRLSTTAGLLVSREYNVGTSTRVNSSLVDQVGSALTSIGANMISAENTALTSTTTVVAPGSADTSDVASAFANSTAVTEQMANLLPSVTVSVSSPTFVNPPRPPPSMPPPPPPTLPPFSPSPPLMPPPPSPRPPVPPRSPPPLLPGGGIKDTTAVVVVSITLSVITIFSIIICILIRERRRRLIRKIGQVAPFTPCGSRSRMTIHAGPYGAADIRVFEFEQQCTRVNDGSLGIRLSATNQIVTFDHNENAEHLRVDDYVIAVDGAPLRNKRLGTALKRLAKENGEALAPVQLTISRAVESWEATAPVEPS